MAQTYCAVNGEVKDINVTGNRFLDKLTFPLWDKLGIPRPLSEADTKLVARMLRNYANLQRIEPGEYFWKEVGWIQNNEGYIIWVEEVAKFFEKSGGLLEEKWKKKSIGQEWMKKSGKEKERGYEEYKRRILKKEQKMSEEYDNEI